MSDPYIFQPEQIADINAAARYLHIPTQLPEDGRAWATILDSAGALELSLMCAQAYGGVYGEELAERLMRLSDELHAYATGVPSPLARRRKVKP